MQESKLEMFNSLIDYSQVLNSDYITELVFKPYGKKQKKRKERRGINLSSVLFHIFTLITPSKSRAFMKIIIFLASWLGLPNNSNGNKNPAETAVDKLNSF